MERMLKKIVIATGIYPPTPGGAATHAYRYREHFNARDIEAPVITYGTSTAGVVGISMRIPFGLRHLIYMYCLWRISRSTRVIFALDALGAGIPALIVARLRGVPLVLRIGGDIVWERKALAGRAVKPMRAWYEHGMHRPSFFGGLLFFLSRAVLVRAKLIVVPTALLADLYMQYYGVVSS